MYLKRTSVLEEQKTTNSIVVGVLCLGVDGLSEGEQSMKGRFGVATSDANA
jgi:hypothetical protein